MDSSKSCPRPIGTIPNGSSNRVGSSNGFEVPETSPGDVLDAQGSLEKFPGVVFGSSGGSPGTLLGPSGMFFGALGYHFHRVCHPLQIPSWFRSSLNQTGSKPSLGFAWGPRNTLQCTAVSVAQTASSLCFAFVIDYRALFQANNDIHTLGKSKTGCYSYDVWLWKVRMVVTIDMTARWDGGEEWIKENCVEVMLDGPCWV